MTGCTKFLQGFSTYYYTSVSFSVLHNVHPGKQELSVLVMQIHLEYTYNHCLLQDLIHIILMQPTKYECCTPVKQLSVCRWGLSHLKWIHFQVVVVQLLSEPLLFHTLYRITVTIQIAVRTPRQSLTHTLIASLSWTHTQGRPNACFRDRQLQRKFNIQIKFNALTSFLNNLQNLVPASLLEPSLLKISLPSH